MRRKTTKTKATKSSRTILTVRDLPRDQARTKAAVDAKAHPSKGGAVTDIDKGVKLAIDL